MLANFFGGLSVTSYIMIGMGTVIAGLMLTVAVQRHTIGNLHESVGAAEHAIDTLLDVNQDNIKSLAAVEAALIQCTDMRQAAEDAIKDALSNTNNKVREALDEQDEREDEVAKVIADSPEPIPNVVPPRATRMLVEAACSANRGKDCSED